MGSGSGSQSWGSRDWWMARELVPHVADSYEWYTKLSDIVDMPHVQDAEDVVRALDKFTSGHGNECNRMGSEFLASTFFRSQVSRVVAHTLGIVTISCQVCTI